MFRHAAILIAYQTDLEDSEWLRESLLLHANIRLASAPMVLQDANGDHEVFVISVVALKFQGE
jgi:hypothetical protein